jgi:hypothetical protein
LHGQRIELPGDLSRIHKPAGVFLGPCSRGNPMDKKMGSVLNIITEAAQKIGYARK